MAFMSRKDLKKKIELEEARKAGLAPAEVDEDGKEINPHIPHYLSIVPFYIRSNSETEGPSLKHQRKWKFEPNNTKSSYDRAAKVHQADKYRKDACENCGAMGHDLKSCIQRPRKVGAKFTNSHIAPDDKIKSFEHHRKRDRWDGYVPANYVHVQEKRHEAREEARRKYLEEQLVKKLEGKNNQGDNDGDDYWVDESSKQMDFAKIEKRVRTTGGGSTGTVRNFRFREDTPKYLVNLDLDSAYYDPKTRSMREDPHPDADPNEKFYRGDNQHRNSGQALEFKRLNYHCYEAFEKGQDIHLQAAAAPSLAELMYNNHQVKKERFKSQMKDTILKKYGNAAIEEELPRELLLDQSEREVEYDCAGRIIK